MTNPITKTWRQKNDPTWCIVIACPGISFKPAAMIHVPSKTMRANENTNAATLEGYFAAYKNAPAETRHTW
eukprot:CAMPEP_0185737520 /NCGR_PEP_ID=MMETSP1171-20130828/30568_1 /TAXON_ID=374046 /ORGANISM="Helicotheca tamensis, Strain CCMP826" /LENGTH=70 /DNA_ID=CAMNT_0028408449 /DNA_START=29 /DNA_END=238 /DNA_ORIENTATION=+